MKTLNLILLLVFSTRAAMSQVPTPPPPPPPPPPPVNQSGQVSKADSLRNDGDLSGAIAEYRKMYLADRENKRIVYDYACALSLDQQTDSCLKYLNISIAMDTTIAALTDPDLRPARNNKHWADFENRIIAMLNKKNKTDIRDIEYAKALWRLKCMDQSLFYETGLAAKKLGPGSPVVTALREYKDYINGSNQKELEVLLNEKGWPRNSEVGKDAAEAAFYVLQHSDPLMQQKYLPLLKLRCEEKEASWIHYAMLFDRMKVNMGLPQRYGTQPILDNRNSGKFELAPLEDKTKVNEWRKEIGLEPLKSLNEDE
jgi:hypothetical protein